MEDPGEVLAGMAAALDAGGRVNPAGLSVERAEAWLCGLQVVLARVQALVAEAAVAADEQRLHQRSGTRDVGDHVGRVTNADPGAVRRDAKLGGFLAPLPVVGAAFAAGELTREHVAVLLRLCTARRRGRFAEAQDFFVRAGRDLSFAEFVRAVQAWAHAADPDGREPDEQVAKRAVTFTDHPDGWVSGRFCLDPVAGRALRNAVEQRAQDLFRAGGDGSSVAQRRADALTELVGAGLSSTKSAPAPLIHVVVSLAVLEKLLAQAAEGTEFPIDVDSLGDTDRRCHFADGTPIHPKFVQALLTVGVIRRLVLDDESIPVEQSKGRRFYPLHMKVAMTAAQRGSCKVAGCTAPIWWHEADHLVAYCAGGKTTWSNGAMTCRAHNLAKGGRLE